MPKLKTNSSAKKRFRFTGTGKIMITQARKRHNLRKRSGKMLLAAKGKIEVAASKAALIRKALPYG